MPKNGCLAAENGCLAAVSAAMAGTVPRRSPMPTGTAARPGAEMAKTPCARPKSRYQARGGKKKNSAPLRYQSPPGVLGPGMALRYSRGWCRGCPKKAAWQRKTAVWQQFALPWQGLGRNRWPPWNRTLVSAACCLIRCHGDVFVCRGSSRALWTFGRRPPSRPAVLSAEGCLDGLTDVATLAHELYWTRVCRQDPR